MKEKGSKNETAPKSKLLILRRFCLLWVDDGARTHDTRNHNPMLYQLNYIHRVLDCKGTKNFVPCKALA